MGCGEGVEFGGWAAMHISRGWSVMRRKVGTGLARHRRDAGSALFDGGFPALVRRGRYGFRMVWGWNGMEWSRAECRRARARGVRRLITQFQDCHYPRPLERAPPVASIFFCSWLLRSCPGTASFRNVNSINASPLLRERGNKGKEEL